jgi:guanyl-specific ribonuclease Sa
MDRSMNVAGFKRFLAKNLLLLLALQLLVSPLTGCFDQAVPSTAAVTTGTTTAASSAAEHLPTPAVTPADTTGLPDVNGHYTTPEDVAAYLLAYQKLPDNYITKSEAVKLGWDASRGNLWDVTDKKSIGGDRFGNREGLLPDKTGRIWYECDVNYTGGYRGPERLVYSNDGLIYYTGDHYGSFVQLNEG